MNLNRSLLPRILAGLAAALAVAIVAPRALGQTATDIYGLYYTGTTNSGGLQTAATQDQHWTVSYASTDGGNTEDTSYEGAPYVITPSAISGSAYTPNTSSAQWVSPPGAHTTSDPSSATNAGGDFMPGNGNSGGTEGVYIYTLAFTIQGTGMTGATVTNNVLITMTLAADDQYAVYVNPAGNGTKIPTETAAATATSAWTNTTQISLQNYGGSNGKGNSKFKIGTNYIVIVVDNTNNINGTSNSNALNASGLLVYQTSAATINGKPVPEVNAWLPLFGAVGVYGIFALRRRRQAIPVRSS